MRSAKWDIKSIKMEYLRRFEPEIHQKLVKFCSELDEKDFPEAVKIRKEEYRTLYGFGRIYEKLKKKSKEEKARKRLEKAKTIVLMISRSLGHAVHAKPRPLAKKEVKARGIGRAARILVEEKIAQFSRYVQKAIMELINTEVEVEKQKTMPWRLVTGTERLDVIDDVLEVYKEAYGKAGLRYARPADLIERMPIWFVSIGTDGKINAFATFSETPRGLRLGLIGADPASNEGRKSAAALLGKLAQMEYVYGNVSGRVAQIAVAGGAAVVDIRLAKRMMGSFKGKRGVGAAQRKIGKIHKMLSPEEFSASPIVSGALEETGKKWDELNFEDLVKQAVATGEIPDTEKAKTNCFALVQFMQGEDRIVKPTLVIKLTVGRPVIEE